jgi:hypothetical protein
MSLRGQEQIWTTLGFSDLIHKKNHNSIFFYFSNQAKSTTKQKKSNLVFRVDPTSNHIDYGILKGCFLSAAIIVFFRSSNYCLWTFLIGWYCLWRVIWHIILEIWQKQITSSDKNPAFHIKYTTVRSKWSAHNRKGRFFSLFMVRGYHSLLQLWAKNKCQKCKALKYF